MHAQVQARERRARRPACTAAGPAPAPSTRAPPRTTTWRARWGRTGRSACPPAAAGPRAPAAAAARRPSAPCWPRTPWPRRRPRGASAPAAARRRRSRPRRGRATPPRARPAARTTAPRARPPACGRPCARGGAGRGRRRSEAEPDPVLARVGVHVDDLVEVERDGPVLDLEVVEALSSPIGRAPSACRRSLRASAVTRTPSAWPPWKPMEIRAVSFAIPVVLRGLNDLGEYPAGRRRVDKRYPRVAYPDARRSSMRRRPASRTASRACSMSSTA